MDKSTRRNFLSQAGVTVAAAIGMAAVPSIAFASDDRSTTKARRLGNRAPNSTITYTCCVNTGCGTSKGCTGTKLSYYCTASASGCPRYCTNCQNSRGNCYRFNTTGGC